MKGTKAKDLRDLKQDELRKKLDGLQNALLVEKKSPKLRPIKKAISRIKTILHQTKNKEVK